MEKFFRGGIKFFWNRQGELLIAMENDIESDVDSKVKKEITFLNVSLYLKHV